MSQDCTPDDDVRPFVFVRAPKPEPRGVGDPREHFLFFLRAMKTWPPMPERPSNDAYVLAAQPYYRLCRSLGGRKSGEWRALFLKNQQGKKGDPNFKMYSALQRFTDERDRRRKEGDPYKERQREYEQRPERKALRAARDKKRDATPERKAQQLAAQRIRRARKKEMTA
jgi:hypothetical protein